MRRKLKAMFTKNIGMKLLSLVLAFLIWIIIMSISDPKVTKTIDGIEIDIRNKNTFNNLDANKDYSIDILTTGTVSIKVTGNRSDMENLKPADFVAYADFNDFVAVNAIPIHVEVRADNMKDRYEITYQSETVLRVNMVKSKTDLFNIVVEMVNVPGNKYALKKSVSSTLLEVTGPEQLIETVGRLVAKVDVSTAAYAQDGSAIIYAPLIPVDKSGNPIDSGSIELAQSQVQVEFELLSVKEVPLILDTTETPVLLGFAVDNRLTKFSPNTVLIAADEDTLKTIREIKIPYTSDEPLRKEGKPIEREFDIVLPKDVYLKSENTSISTSITVEALGEQELTIPKILISTQNLPEGFEILYSQDPDGSDEVTFTISGFKPDVDSVGTALTLHPYVDLSEVMSTGYQAFPIKFNSDIAVTTEGEVELLIQTKKEE